ncbi:Na+/H+ antiporter NhaA, partial [Eggerthella sinensis]|uniref:Na+/H+ antiporter NhaA n=1 Tax=Eggerthella sinensis TaxID=242230 RepID=UPI001D08ED7F
PRDANWLHIYGVSLIAGIGFTMSLFIGLLAFRSEEMEELTKLGVFSGSMLSALWGWTVLKFAKRPENA